MNLNRAPLTPWAFAASRGLLAAAALLALTVSAVSAQEQAPPTPVAPEAPPAAPDLTPGDPAPDPRPDDPEFVGVAGRIVEIGERSLVVLPNDSRQKVTVRVPEGARIRLNREQVGMSHLKVGDHVRVTMAARGSDLAREVLAARMAPNPNPRPAPTPRPAQDEEEGVNVAVSETGNRSEAGMGLVLTAAPNGGVMVVDAQENSPAARAGLRGGDLIVSLEGEELPAPKEFVSRVRERRPGESVELVVARASGAIKGEVSLARRQEAPDVVIRRPVAAAPRGATDEVEVERELDVSTDTPPAAVPVDGAGANDGRAAGGDLQRIEQTLQTLLQEIRALRQELRGRNDTGAAAPARAPGEATGNNQRRQDRD